MIIMSYGFQNQLKQPEFKPLSNVKPAYLRDSIKSVSALFSASAIQDFSNAPKFSGSNNTVTNSSNNKMLMQSANVLASALTKLGKNAELSKEEKMAQVTQWLTEAIDSAEVFKSSSKNIATMTRWIKNQVGDRGQGHMMMGQLNPVPGDVEGNAQKVMRSINIAEASGLDAVIFPELSLMGYPIQDVIVRYPSIVEENVRWLNEIAKRTGETKALVGFVEPRNVPSGEQLIGKPYYNSMAVLGNGRIEGVVRKTLLPTYNEFNDDRTFQSAPAVGMHASSTLGDGEWGFQTPATKGTPLTISHNGHTKIYGLTICEDTWNNAEFFTDVLYASDPVDDVATDKTHNAIDALINISASPTRARKEQMKHNMLSHIAQQYKVPYVYVNQVGANDEIIFDGSSRVYGADGSVIDRAESFKQSLVVVNPFIPTGVVNALPQGQEKTLTAVRGFNLDYENDLDRTYQSLVLGIRDYFEKNNFKRAVLGLSGGLDSSVVAVLLADALGAENVLGVSMPSGITSDNSRNDAKVMAENLGMQYQEVPIQPMVNPLMDGVKGLAGKLLNQWGEANPKSTAGDNSQAITRATILRALGNNYHALPIATSDKSELYMGYATVNGDMSGALAPIADVVKTKAKALAYWMNENRDVKNAIPVAVMEKKPGAELQLDENGNPVNAEDVLMPYEFLDEVIWREENMGESLSQMKDHTFLFEQMMTDAGTPVSAEQKEVWLNRFMKLRNSVGVFKWKIAPPGLISDARGVTSAQYQQLITTKINVNPYNDGTVSALLNECAVNEQNSDNPQPSFT